MSNGPTSRRGVHDQVEVDDVAGLLELARKARAIAGFCELGGASPEQLARLRDFAGGLEARAQPLVDYLAIEGTAGRSLH